MRAVQNREKVRATAAATYALNINYSARSVTGSCPSALSATTSRSRGLTLQR